MKALSLALSVAAIALVASFSVPPAAAFAQGEVFLPTLYASEPGLRWLATGDGPVWSPDGSKIAYYNPHSGAFHVIDADGSDQTKVADIDDGEYYLPTWSPDSTSIAFWRNPDPEGDDDNDDIYVVGVDGNGEVNLTNHPWDDESPAWSPGGSRIAFVREGAGIPGPDIAADIYIMNSDGSDQVNLTNDPSGDTSPAWSPDGSKIMFFSYRDGDGDIFVMDPDGSNPTSLNAHVGYRITPGIWSPDGSKIAFNEEGAGGWDIIVMNADGSNRTNITSTSGISEGQLSWSPSGNQVAFTVRELVDGEVVGSVYIMDVSGSNRQELTSGGDPAWSPLGDKIAIYRWNDGPIGIYLKDIP